MNDITHERAKWTAWTGTEARIPSSEMHTKALRPNLKIELFAHLPHLLYQAHV
jgi:hypothetical protein